MHSVDSKLGDRQGEAMMNDRGQGGRGVHVYSGHTGSRGDQIFLRIYGRDEALSHSGRGGERTD